MLNTYLLDACCEVSQVPDCNGLVMGEIYISLEVEESEDFGLGGELRAEVLLVDLLGVNGLLGGLPRVHLV